MLEIAPGADRDLQNLSLNLGTGPFAPTREENPVEEVHLPVVATGVLVLNPADPLALAHVQRLILRSPAHHAAHASSAAFHAKQDRCFSSKAIGPVHSPGGAR